MGGAGDVGPPRGEDEDRGGDGEHEQAPGDAGDLERGGEGLARVGGRQLAQVPGIHVPLMTQILMLLTLIIIMVFPDIALWLPHQVYGN